MPQIICLCDLPEYLERAHLKATLRLENAYISIWGHTTPFHYLVEEHRTEETNVVLYRLRDYDYDKIAVSVGWLYSRSQEVPQ